ncbi:MAG: antitoxin [Planctomycetes bacterium RIFCSPHIGHO2_02_FULL_50_42]|nr:MAG: antitoxin [Planctomycetes bacterium RIFCSPHIGHO2_02_FULL_50_42]OHB95565.1 MAG: antitoxin [Planctomycetes bacterium RIFCSPLOWO2_02_FULL_50_16]OHC03741.1 MAG: antitoxin [Planctomycetes bacterium RIFCSPLOWO2_12_FULL_50_35]
MKERIEIDPNVCHGQPCIKGTRVMVYLILELLKEGLTPEDIIRDYYPNLAVEDIKACLDYAAFLIKEQEFIPFEEVV